MNGSYVFICDRVYVGTWFNVSIRNIHKGIKNLVNS